MIATVTFPYQDPRSRVGRDGQREWSVTTWDGAFSETQKFYERADADRAFGEAVEVGFAPIGEGR